MGESNGAAGLQTFDATPMQKGLKDVPSRTWAGIDKTTNKHSKKPCGRRAEVAN